MNSPCVSNNSICSSSQLSYINSIIVGGNNSAYPKKAPTGNSIKSLNKTLFTAKKSRKNKVKRIKSVIKLGVTEVNCSQNNQGSILRKDNLKSQCNNSITVLNDHELSGVKQLDSVIIPDNFKIDTLHNSVPPTFIQENTNDLKHEKHQKYSLVKSKPDSGLPITSINSLSTYNKKSIFNNKKSLQNEQYNSIVKQKLTKIDGDSFENTQSIMNTDLNESNNSTAVSPLKRSKSHINRSSPCVDSSNVTEIDLNDPIDSIVVSPLKKSKNHTKQNITFNDSSDLCQIDLNESKNSNEGAPWKNSKSHKNQINTCLDSSDHIKINLKEPKNSIDVSPWKKSKSHTNQSSICVDSSDVTDIDLNELENSIEVSPLKMSKSNTDQINTCVDSSEMTEIDLNESKNNIDVPPLKKNKSHKNQSNTNIDSSDLTDIDLNETKNSIEVSPLKMSKSHKNQSNTCVDSSDLTDIDLNETKNSIEVSPLKMSKSHKNQSNTCVDSSDLTDIDLNETKNSIEVSPLKKNKNQYNTCLDSSDLTDIDLNETKNSIKVSLLKKNKSHSNTCVNSSNMADFGLNESKNNIEMSPLKKSKSRTNQSISFVNSSGLAEIDINEPENSIEVSSSSIKNKSHKNQSNKCVNSSDLIEIDLNESKNSIEVSPGKMSKTHANQSSTCVNSSDLIEIDLNESKNSIEVSPGKMSKTHANQSSTCVNSSDLIEIDLNETKNSIEVSPGKMSKTHANQSSTCVNSSDLIEIDLNEPKNSIEVPPWKKSISHTNQSHTCIDSYLTEFDLNEASNIDTVITPKLVGDNLKDSKITKVLVSKQKNHNTDIGNMSLLDVQPAEMCLDYSENIKQLHLSNNIGNSTSECDHSNSSEIRASLYDDISQPTCITSCKITASEKIISHFTKISPLVKKKSLDKACNSISNISEDCNIFINSQVKHIASSETEINSVFPNNSNFLCEKGNNLNTHTVLSTNDILDTTSINNSINVTDSDIKDSISEVKTPLSVKNNKNSNILKKLLIKKNLKLRRNIKKTEHNCNGDSSNVSKYHGVITQKDISGETDGFCRISPLRNKKRQINTNSEHLVLESNHKMKDLISNGEQLNHKPPSAQSTKHLDEYNKEICNDVDSDILPDLGKITKTYEDEKCSDTKLSLLDTKTDGSRPKKSKICLTSKSKCSKKHNNHKRIQVKNPTGEDIEDSNTDRTKLIKKTAIDLEINNSKIRNNSKKKLVEKKLHTSSNNSQYKNSTSVIIKSDFTLSEDESQCDDGITKKYKHKTTYKRKNNESSFMLNPEDQCSSIPSTSRRKPLIWTSTPIVQGKAALLNKTNSKIHTCKSKNKITLEKIKEKTHNNVMSRSLADKVIKKIENYNIDSDYGLNRLKGLKIDITWELSKLHQIDTGCPDISNLESALDQRLINTTTLIKEEEEIIKMNWKRFSSAYGFKVTEPFTSLSTLHKHLQKGEVIKFQQFLAKGLPDRKLYTIYSKFVEMFAVSPTYRLSQVEDQILLDLYRLYNSPEKKELLCNILLPKILERRKKNIKTRLRSLLKHKPNLDYTEEETIYWTSELEGKLVHLLLEKSNADSIEELRAPIPPLSVWNEVERELDLPFCQVVDHWKCNLYPRLFSTNPILCPVFYAQLIKWIHDAGIKEWEDVNWDNLSIAAGGVGPYFVSKCMRWLVLTFVPHERHKVFRASIRYLYLYCYPSLVEEEHQFVLKRVRYNPDTRLLEGIEDVEELSSDEDSDVY